MRGVWSVIKWTIVSTDSTRSLGLEPSYVDSVCSRVYDLLIGIAAQRAKGGSSRHPDSERVDFFVDCWKLEVSGSQLCILQKPCAFVSARCVLGTLFHFIVFLYGGW